MKPTLKYLSASRPRHELVKHIPLDCRNVLEVGCGLGLTGEMIKNELGCQVFGIDVSDDAIEHAREKNCYTALACVNIEEDDSPFDSQAFDCILYPDVLEHLVDPWSLLAKHTTLLNPGGTIIASIPNVRHFSALFPLLFRGKWQYQEMGILDSSHLRFFTRHSIIELFEKSNLEIACLENKLLAKKKIKKLNRWTRGVFKDFITLQYIVVATKPG